MELTFGIFRLEASAWESSLDDFLLGLVALGRVLFEDARLEISAQEFPLGIFRLGIVAWEAPLGVFAFGRSHETFLLKTSTWNILLGTLRLNRSLETLHLGGFA